MLLLGVTGAIGAASVPHFLYGLRQIIAPEIVILLSRTAATLVSPYALSVLSGSPVFTSVTDKADGVSVPHIELPRRAGLFAILPATANIMAKCAHGVCDDLISTSVLATPEDVPVVFVPSMNETMWDKKLMRENVVRLRDAGYYVIDPVAGYEVADMKTVRGAMPPIEQVCIRLLEIRSSHGLK